MDDMNTDPVQVTTNRTSTEVRIRWGATTVRLSVEEAVDLVDAVASVLATQPRLLAPTTSPTCTKAIGRDEAAVRAAAEIREAL
ncbi:hypothetical protein HQ308_16900 [Rhodococcus sp. BP-241]|uniref:hypothetical protein n=1 Tax=Rhodococcus sp. BP-241 TaxID=2739441 RepID=UPI001C9B95E6|nr:hypothetical protein [Rhodococcus sp. BP-241]MBY6708481.1 hypothetical protein [Rhodococcus sp. BP-241]